MSGKRSLVPPALDRQHAAGKWIIQSDSVEQASIAGSRATDQCFDIGREPLNISGVEAYVIR